MTVEFHLHPQLRSAGLRYLLAGLGLALGPTFLYSSAASTFGPVDNRVLLALTRLSYLTMILLFLGITISVLAMYRILRGDGGIHSGRSRSRSISRTLRNILVKRRYWRAMVFAAVIYAIFYAVVSGAIVYRPTENFALEYYAAIPSATVVVCCGNPGYIPFMTVYLTQHLGLLIIPVNVLLLVFISALVGVNVSLAMYQFENRRHGVSRLSFGGVGAITGLFTACPTCAALFLGNLVAGMGASAMAIALASYQPVFVAVTVPVLLGSIVFIGRRLSHASEVSCALRSVLKS